MKTRFWILFALTASLTALAATPEPQPEAKPPQAAGLAECSKLETSEKSECELRVRQGLDEREPGSLAQATPEPNPLPTDRVPPAEPVEDEDE